MKLYDLEEYIIVTDQTTAKAIEDDHSSCIDEHTFVLISENIKIKDHNIDLKTLRQSPRSRMMHA